MYSGNSSGIKRNTQAMTALVYQRICFAILYNTFQRNSAGFWVLSQNPKFSTIWGYNKNKSLKGKKEREHVVQFREREWKGEKEIGIKERNEIWRGNAKNERSKE